MSDRSGADARTQAIVAGLIAYGVGLIPPLAIHRASGAGGLGHLNRGAFIALGLVTLVPVGIAFGWHTYRHLQVATRYASRRASEVWAAYFAGISVYGMLVAVLPAVIWWWMVNDDTSISDRGGWFYLAWVVGNAFAAGLGLLASTAVFGAGKARRQATIPAAATEAPAS